MKVVKGSVEKEVGKIDDENHKPDPLVLEKREEIKNIIKQAIREGNLWRDEKGRFHLFGKKDAQ